MSHNPLIRSIRVGLFSSPGISLHTQGVVFINNQPKGVVFPGETVPKGKNTLLFIIDCAPHQFEWTVSLPTCNESESFSTQIRLKYRVHDGLKMVNDQIMDTEAMVKEILFPILRSVSRRFVLHRYLEVESQLNLAISSKLFNENGLELLQTSVEISLTSEQKKWMMELEQALKGSLVSRREVVLPTKKSLYGFKAVITLEYKVAEVDLLPGAELNETVERIWLKVIDLLKKTARNFLPEEIKESENAMEEALEREVFGIHGLEIMSTTITLSYDEQFQSFVESLEDEERNKQIKDIQIQRKIEQDKTAIEFYGTYIKNKDWSLLAPLLAGNERDALEILDELDKKSMQTLEAQIQFCKNLKDMQILDTVFTDKNGETAFMDFVGGVFRNNPTKEFESQPLLDPGKKLNNDDGNSGNDHAEDQDEV